MVVEYRVLTEDMLDFSASWIICSLLICSTSGGKNWVRGSSRLHHRVLTELQCEYLLFVSGISKCNCKNLWEHPLPSLWWWQTVSSRPPGLFFTFSFYYFFCETMNCVFEHIFSKVANLVCVRVCVRERERKKCGNKNWSWVSTRLNQEWIISSSGVWTIKFAQLVICFLVSQIIKPSCVIHLRKDTPDVNYPLATVKHKLRLNRSNPSLYGWKW